MAKQMFFEDDGRRKILDGIGRLARAVKVTMGPTGKNVLFERGFGSPTITKDGVTVAKEIALEDPFENMGAQLVREVASKTSDEAGDGTTTATLLAEAIYGEGLKMVTGGMNPVEVRRGIDAAVAAAIEALDGMSKPCKTREEIAQVATISANNDPAIGDLLADAMEKVGHEGVIIVEEGKTTETVLEIVEGMQLDKGYISPHFINNPEDMDVVLEDAYILLHEKKISNVRELLPLLEKIAQAAKPILIIAEDVEGEALAALVINKLRGILPCCAVKAPGFGDRRKAMLQDIAVMAGGKVISEDLGMKLENVELSDLGRAKQVKIDKDNTTIVRGAGTKSALDARIAQLKTQIETTTSDYDKEKLQERLAKLAGGVAQINVGAATETQMKEKKSRIEDALHACRAAAEEGIIPGGGVAYLRALEAVEKAKTRLRGEEKTGADILLKVLRAPAAQIAQNAGHDGSVVVDEILALGGNKGFNAAAGEYVDMLKAGIVDPTKVAKCALQNAASIAGLLLTSETLVTELPKGKGKKPVLGSVH